jgi:redox-sensitive bicupin YhaK (pirin superfamily)
VALYLGELAAGYHLDYPMTEGRGLWLQLVAGELDIAGTTLRAGDGLQVTDETQARIEASQHAEFLLFDLPVMK